MARTDILAINAKTISINGVPIAGSAAPVGLVTTFDQLDADAVLALNGAVIQGVFAPGMTFTNYDNINVLSGVSLGDTVKYGTASTPASGNATGPIVPYPGGVTPTPTPTPPPTPDADATAYVARMTVAPSTEQATAYDYFVKQAKAIGVWPYITDCGFLCAHDAQSSRLGVKNAINLSLVGTAPNMTAGHGVTGNGTSQAFDTGYKFPAGQQDNAHIGVYSLTSSQSDNGDAGNTNTVIIARGTADTASSRTNAAASGTSASLDGLGLFISNRTASATTGGKLWKRNAVLTTSQGASAVPDATYTLWIGGRNGATPQFSARGMAFWTIGTGIPDALVPAYGLLIEQACSMLAASYTVATATTKTKALYRHMIRMTRQPAYMLGAFDNGYWGLGTTPNLLADIATMTSKVPAIISHEWVDPLASDAAAAGPAQLQRIKDHYAAGGIVSIHHHPGNPVTGSFQQLPTAEGTAGNQYDMTGSPVVACLAGGSRRTQFLAYVDRLIAFFQSCVDANGEPIPLIFRPWHENNGAFFWWTDTTTPSNTAQLYRDTVDRIKAAGVQNVLYDWNSNFSPAPALGAFYPGLAYADFLSLDYYETGATPVGMASAEGLLGGLGSAVNRRPLHLAEIGYSDGAGTSSGLWNTRTGFYHRDRISRSSHFLPWRNPHAPKPGDATQADFAAMVAEANCITRDRLSGVYA
jgi:hypothetical protein